MICVQNSNIRERKTLCQLLRLGKWDVMAISFVVWCPSSTTAAAAATKLLQACPTLCDPIDGSPPASSVPGILQARILECVAISFSNACMHAKSLQLCLTLCDPTDSSPPSSSVHGILQARILDWVAISFSDQTLYNTNFQSSYNPIYWRKPRCINIVIRQYNVFKSQ